MTRKKKPAKVPSSPETAAVRDQVSSAIAALSPSPSYHLCRIMVQVSVPLRILAIQERGGITPEDFARIHRYADEFAGEDGVYLIVRSPKPGVTARLFNHLCDAIAVLAFVPGGITIFDDQYDATTPSPDPSAER